MIGMETVSEIPKSPLNQGNGSGRKRVGPFRFQKDPNIGQGPNRSMPGALG